jgi:N-methylhydantoinase A
MADVIMEQSCSVPGSVGGGTYHSLMEMIREMENKAETQLSDEDILRENITHRGLVHARYRGQSHELTIPLVPDLDRAFHTEHLKTYGHSLPGREVEVVTLRLQSIGLSPKPSTPLEPTTWSDGSSAVIGTREGIVTSSRASIFTLYERDKLTPGTEFTGPALVFQMDSTVYIPSHWAASVDGYHNLILTIT